MKPKTAHLKTPPTVSLEVVYEAGLENEAILKEIKKAWGLLGVQLNLTPLEKGILLDRVDQGNFDLALMKWSGISSPSVLTRMLYSHEIGKGKNSGHYQSKKMDLALEKKNIAESLKIFQEDLPHFPLWFPDNLAVTNQSIVDFQWYPTGAWASFLHARRVE
jgi:ABC-type transport system substrate-binding protein